MDFISKPYVIQVKKINSMEFILDLDYPGDF